MSVTVQVSVEAVQVAERVRNMEQPKTRAEKLQAAGIRKYGSLAAYKQSMAERGKKGGRNGTGHQFAHGFVDPSKAGSIGGKRRGKSS